MHYTSLDQMIRTDGAKLAKGPIAIVMVEDDVEVDTTLRHHQQSGFTQVLALQYRDQGRRGAVDILLL